MRHASISSGVTFSPTALSELYLRLEPSSADACRSASSSLRSASLTCRGVVSHVCEGSDDMQTSAQVGRACAGAGWERIMGMML